jgi:HlyD family secretion protein
MNSFTRLFIPGSLLILTACNSKNNSYDASGTFEADEVIVSSLASGRILSLKCDEGSVLARDSIVGLVDPSNLYLQKQEVEATIESLGQQTANVGPQVKLLEDQLTVQQSVNNLMHKRKDRKPVETGCGHR